MKNHEKFKVFIETKRVYKQITIKFHLKKKEIKKNMILINDVSKFNCIWVLRSLFLFHCL